MVVHEWVSTTRTEHVDLPAGDYTIHEVSAPAGCLTAEDIVINLSRNNVMTLKETGDVLSPAVMQDDWTKVTITKQNAAGDALPGAALALYKASDTTNNVPNEGVEPVRQWTSAETPEEFLATLEADKTYVLIEESAPEEYAIAQPVIFTVKTNGAEQEIVMVDPKDGAEVTFIKNDGDGNMLTGAELTVYRVKDGAADESFESVTWVSDDAGSHTVKLESGDYVFHEETAPAGYAAAEDITFTVTDDGKVLIGDAESPTITMVDEMEEHELSVIKVVKGNMGDKTKDFTFKLKLTPPEGDTLPSEISVHRYEGEAEPVEETLSLTDGECTFTLRHGERIGVTFPYGTTYEVSELDGGADGYTVTSENETGTVTTTDMAVSFTNTKSEGISTGFAAMTGLMGSFLLSAGLLIFLIYKRKKRIVIRGSPNFRSAPFILQRIPPML